MIDWAPPIASTIIGTSGGNPSELACVIGKPQVLAKIPMETPILFGTSIYSHPNDDPELPKRRPIRQVLVPSDWVRDMFAEVWPGRVSVWPVGIDTERWQPDPASDTALLCPVLVSLRIATISGTRIDRSNGAILYQSPRSPSMSPWSELEDDDGVGSSSTSRIIPDVVVDERDRAVVAAARVQHLLGRHRGSALPSTIARKQHVETNRSPGSGGATRGASIATPS